MHYQENLKPVKKRIFDIYLVKIERCDRYEAFSKANVEALFVSCLEKCHSFLLHKGRASFAWIAMKMQKKHLRERLQKKRASASIGDHACLFLLSLLKRSLPGTIVDGRTTLFVLFFILHAISNDNNYI